MKIIGTFLTLIGVCFLLAATFAADAFFEDFFFGKLGVYFAGVMLSGLGGTFFIEGLKEQNRAK